MPVDMKQNRRLVYAWFGLRSLQDTYPGVHWQYEGDVGDSSCAFNTWLEAEQAYNELVAHAQVVGVVPDKTPVDLKLASAFKAAGQAAVGVATKEAMKQFGEAYAAQQRVAHLEAEIAKLADVLLKDFGGPTENESACEMAVRLLKEFKSASEDIQISKTSVKDMRAAGWQCATSFDEKDRLLHYIPILQREWPDQKVQYTQNDDGFRVWVRKG